MSRRTTGIITAVVLILLGAAAGYGINNVLATRAPEQGLSEAQVGTVVTKLITARNDELLSPDPSSEDDEDAEEDEEEPSAAADLLEGRSSGGITMSQGAITAEKQTYRLIREHKRDLEQQGTVYFEADLDVEVGSLTINEGTAIAIVEETSTYSGERVGKELEVEQNVERVVSLTRVGGNWIMRSMRTMSGKDAPENGL
ncbi:hypothetical protein [Solicola gregarius]|uniref:Uncharacterized protein n=1 Tax=Solicola gregarius TaxID=2908642 RepID=A0AA46TIS9_9ACTN|nr:hypothetical protein [Solicola gregarius]UYM05900.1 hypothetical protein L0C25_02160 [Solicola gregarius]